MSSVAAAFTGLSFYSASATPTILFLDQEGLVVHEYGRFLEAPEFLKLLETARNRQKENR